MTKLSDTQLVLLSGAAQRADHLVAVPDRLSPTAAKRPIAKLLAAGFIEEIPAPRKTPGWRMQDEQPLALRITTAGLAAIGIEDAETDPQPRVTGRSVAPTTTRGRARKSDKKAASAAPSCQLLEPGPAGRDTKQGRILAMLHTGTGVTLAEMMDATGWQAHSVRGFLSAVVRKKLGLPIASEKATDGERHYRIPSAAAAGRR